MVEVEEVAVLDRAFAGFCGGVAVDVAGRDSSIEGTSGVCFFCPPKENVRPEAFGSPPDDFGSGGTGTSTAGFFSTARHSSGPTISAEDGAVDALLWRDEFSVEEAVLVVFEEPLPLPTIRTWSRKTSTKQVSPPTRPEAAVYVPVRLQVCEYIVVGCDVRLGRLVDGMRRCRDSGAAIKRFRPNHLGAFQDAEGRARYRGIFERVSGRLPPAERN